MFKQLFRNCMFWTFLSLTIGCCWTFNQSEHWFVNFVLRRKSQRRFIADMAMCHNNTGTLKNVNRWKTHENWLFHLTMAPIFLWKSLVCPIKIKPDQIKPRKPNQTKDIRSKNKWKSVEKPTWPPPGCKSLVRVRGAGGSSADIACAHLWNVTHEKLLAPEKEDTNWYMYSGDSLTCQGGGQSTVQGRARGGWRGGRGEGGGGGRQGGRASTRGPPAR